MKEGIPNARKQGTSVYGWDDKWTSARKAVNGAGSVGRFMMDYRDSKAGEEELERIYVSIVSANGKPSKEKSTASLRYSTFRAVVFSCFQSDFISLFCAVNHLKEQGTLTALLIRRTLKERGQQAHSTQRPAVRRALPRSVQ